MADEVWDIPEKTATRYCREKRVEGAVARNKQWYIPVESPKPLARSEMRQLLIMSLWLRNSPQEKISWPRDTKDSTILTIYNQLAHAGYIEPFDSARPRQIPYKVVLTRRGFYLAVYNRNI
jgi:hypothetical protein